MNRNTPIFFLLVALGSSLSCGGPETAEPADDHAGHDHGAGEHGASTSTGVVSASASNRVVSSADDWCAGHDIPESMCTLCNPQLAAGFQAAGDWCAEHSLPESACPLCGHGIAPPGGTAVPDWCAGHGVPESQCTICNPQLAAGYQASGDWCAEHSLPESVCPLCGQGVAPPEGLVARDWCVEHGVPESVCTICNPGLIPSFQAAGDWCAEHSVPESMCSQCGNGLLSTSVAGLVIRFKDADRERAAGLQTRPAGGGEHDHVIEAPARIDHDRNRLSQVTAQLGGFVREVDVDLGDTVSEGVELFVIDSLELAEARRSVGPARQQVELARERVKREQLLDDRGIGSRAAVGRAKADLATHRSALGRLEARLAMAGPPVSGEGTYAVRAPRAGTVVERPALLGAAAEPGTVLALLADVQSAWAWADVTTEFAARLEEGLSAEVVIPGLEPMYGEVTWISPQVDERTRTVAVRIQLSDPDDVLRQNQFGLARLSLEADDSRSVVPSEALQQVGNEVVIFVNTAPLTYETRVVTASHRRNGGVEVDGGVGPGDPIVTVGAYLLKTELLRDSIGAGCCEVDSIEGK